MADQRSVFVPFDLDTGGGTENVLGINLRISGSGGSIEAKGSQASADSIPVVIASDQAALDVSAATVTVDSELPAAAVLGDDTANPTVPGVGAFGMMFDGATWDRMRGTSAAGLLVDTELPVAAALADAAANPTVPGVGAFGMGYNGTTWDRIRTANTGRLQVDVITGGGTDTPTNPVTDFQTSASLAAGSSVDLTTAEATSKKLAAVEIWSSVNIKAFIHTVDNAVESTDPIIVGGGSAMNPFVYKASHRNYFVLGATAGLDAFRAKVTNLDDNLPANVYAAFHFED